MQVLNTEAEPHTKIILSAAPIRFEAGYVARCVGVKRVTFVSGRAIARPGPEATFFGVCRTPPVRSSTVRAIRQCGAPNRRHRPPGPCIKPHDPSFHARALSLPDGCCALVVAREVMLSMVNTEISLRMAPETQLVSSSLLMRPLYPPMFTGDNIVS